MEDLLKPENKGKLAKVLTFHVVSGRVYASDALKVRKADTLAGQPIGISVQDAPTEDRLQSALAEADRIFSQQGLRIGAVSYYALADAAFDRADVRLEPIWGPGDFNHLSVRSAVAIYLDRLFGRR